jgi:hypothetical protein
MTFARCKFHLSLAITVSLALCQAGEAQIFNGSPPTAEEQPTVGGTPQMRQDSEVKQTAWPSIPLPKISMPSISMPDMSAITAPVKSGYSKMATGTKKVWEGTKEMFTFGKNDAPTQTVARTSAQSEPGFWERLTSPAPKKDGPQTVGEWMAQPRLDH